MPIEITMPRLSDTMEVGTLVKWRVDIAIGTAALDPSSVDPKVAEQLRRHGYWRTPEGG